MKYISLFKLLVIGLILGFVVKWVVIEVFTVPTASMEPTILRGDIVWINKIPIGSFVKNDIIAFNRNGENFIKRIIGTPADSVYKILGHYQVARFSGRAAENTIFYKIPKKGDDIVINASNIDFYKPLIEQCEGVQAGQIFDKIYIKGIETNHFIFTQNYYFVQGDNVDDSVDSRIWGLISEKQILGKCFWIQKRKGKN